jgi:hypothetical protein
MMVINQMNKRSFVIGLLSINNNNIIIDMLLNNTTLIIIIGVQTCTWTHLSGMDDNNMDGWMTEWNQTGMC